MYNVRNSEALTL